MKIDFSHLKQERGRWIAAVTSPSLRRKFGADTVPVLRRLRGDDQWTSGPPMRFHADAESRPDRWWMKAGQDEWRRLLRAGAPVYLRWSVADDSPTGSVGAPIGVFAVQGLVLTDDELSFTLGLLP